MSPTAAPFEGRTAALATRHGKEGEIAPALRPTSLTVVVADVDTDAFGTFTGEKPRAGDPVAVAERKARAGMRVSGLDAGLASEGSFGPHPDAPFTTVDVEVVLLVDDRLGLVVVEREVSFDTAAASVTVTPGHDPAEFLARVGFPSQALVCRPADGSPARITKGIVEPEALRRAVVAAADASRDGRAIVETDLRAHLCPTRRPVIRRAAERLARRLMTPCPSCERPGFGVARVEPGLPCRACGAPTRRAAARLLGCPGCGHERREPVREAADPAHCDRCNP